MKGVDSLLLAFLALILINDEVQSDAHTEFVTGNHLFSHKLYQEIIKQKEGNFIVSPYSAQIVLALTKEGAVGSTAEEFVTALNLPSSTEKLREAIIALPTEFRGSQEKPYKILNANKVYINKGCPIKENFKNIVTKYYNAQIGHLEFGNPEKSARKINHWVSQNTNKIIKKIAEPDALKDAVAVLVNALYFKGLWQNEFPVEDTEKERFYKSEKDSVLVDTMYKISSFKLYRDSELDAKFLELDYKGGDVTMTIILPNKIEGLEQLQNRSAIFERPDYKAKILVEVRLPKFEIESSISFIPILKKLGLSKIFGNKADLSGMAGEKGDIHISNVLQKGFIRVSERGTEVGLTSSADAVSHMLPITFNADHPFIFYIKYKDIILLLGRYNSPE